MSQSQTPCRLDLHLLGTPQVLCDGKHITRFRSSKAQALLYFLAVTGSLQRRTILSALLWPEAAEQQAGASLRNVLSNLRALAGDHLTITREAASLSRDRLWLDVAQFDALLKRTGDTETDIVQLEAAVSLYRGDFLEGFHVPDAPQFELWATIERERLRQAVLTSHLMLAEWHMSQDDFASALEDLTRLLSIDSANEAGHRQKMMVLARMGQRSAALQQYEACLRSLTEELGVEPSPQTTAVYELILAGALEAAPPGASEVSRGGTAPVRSQPLPTGDSRPVPPPPRHADTSMPAKGDRKWAIDQRDMPERTAFHGRQEDLARLTQWLTKDGASLAAISGMGGVGKTTLAVELVARLAPDAFDRLLWRSLVNAPPLNAVLGVWLQVMAGQQVSELPESLDEKLSMLLDGLRRQRCLLVLDNLESIMGSDDRSGRFCAGYDEYSRLIDFVSRTRHRSCLLLTTRELPKALRILEEDTPRVRVLPLEGLPSGPAIRLLRERGVSAPDPLLRDLVECYSGNPLALKLVADTVRDLFGNDVSAFFGDQAPVFDDIRRLLEEQFGRLSELGREIMVWLAVQRQPVALQTLWHDLASPPRRAEFLEVIRTLQNSSLVEVVMGRPESVGTRLGLQNVVMEYLTDLLVRTVGDEVQRGRMAWLHRHALVVAQSREHVQESQRRLLLEPIARRLVDSRGRPGAIQHLREMLAGLREEAAPAASYAAANILHLLLYLEADLRGWDFSGLAVRQADLRTAPLAGVDLRRADLGGSVFPEIFGAVRAIAMSPDGRYLAAGESEGSVLVWRMGDYQLHLALKGHTQTVSSVVFSPSGGILASGGFDGRICLWDPATGEPLAAVAAHADTIGGIAFSPDGDQLASGGSDNQIRVWDWRRGEILCTLQETTPVNGLAFSPDGRWLIAATDGREVSVWDWRSGSLLRTLSGHADKVRCVACSPDGAWAATGGEDGRICLWRLAEPDGCRTLDEDAGWVWSLAFSPDGASLASASTDRTVRLWDVATGQFRRTLIGHTSWASAVAYSPDGTVVASGGYDQTIRLWEVRTGLPARTLRGHQRRVDLVSFGPGGKTLASSGFGGSIHLWDVGSGRHLHRLVGHRGAIRAIAISETDEVVAGGCDDHGVYLWDSVTGELRHTLLGHTDLVRHVVFSPDGQYLMTGSHDRTLRTWEAATGRLLHVHHRACAKIQFAAAFSPDGLMLAYGSYDGTVELCDVSSGKTVGSLPLAQEQPVAVAFSAQGRLLACGTECGAVWVWQVDQGYTGVTAEPRFRVQPVARMIWRILFSPDDKLLAVCSDGGAAQVIDLARGEVAHSLPVALGAFNLAFGGGGRCLATGGADNAVYVRDAATGEVRRTLKGHLAEVTSLDVSPAGNVIASGSVDGAVRLWNLESGDCLATLVPAGRYAEMNIKGATGITPAQRATLVALGAR